MVNVRHHPVRRQIVPLLGFRPSGIYKTEPRQTTPRNDVLFLCDGCEISGKSEWEAMNEGTFEFCIRCIFSFCVLSSFYAEFDGHERTGFIASVEISRGFLCYFLSRKESRQHFLNTASFLCDQRKEQRNVFCSAAFFRGEIFRNRNARFNRRRTSRQFRCVNSPVRAGSPQPASKLKYPPD